MEDKPEESKQSMSEIMAAQIHEIDVHKWIESEKAGHDLGDEAVKDWIEKHAAEFREKWNLEHGIEETTKNPNQPGISSEP